MQFRVMSGAMLMMAATVICSQAQTTMIPAKDSRSTVRAQHGMVSTSQPLASQVGLDVLKRGGNAVDAAIAVAAMLNVTEPMMTGVGGDAFIMVYRAKTRELKGLNASGRAPQALTLQHFQQKGLKQIPIRGMESISVPGAFDGWVTLLNQYGTMKMADLLQPAISYAENGFPVMEKTAEDWDAEVEVLKRDPASTATYLLNGRAPKAGEIFRNPNLARTLRTLATGGRDALYRGEIGRAMVAYFQQHGGYITMEDLAAQHAEWVDPISTDYRGYKVFEMPPNSQGLTALIALNILENFDLASMWAQQPDAYYHTQIEAMKLAFADRDRYIADPKFAEVPVEQLLSKDYAKQRAALIKPESAIPDPHPGVLMQGSTTYFTVVDKDHNAVSFINSLYEHFGSGVTAGDTGIMMQDRGSQFSLDPNSPNVIAPGKRPFHTIIPAMVFKDDKLLFSFGVMGGAMQPQGHVEVLTRIIDLGMGLQEAVDAPRFRYDGGTRVIMEEAMGADVISALQRRGHKRVPAPGGNTRSAMGGAQLIMIDPETGALAGASDPRKDGQAVGW
ncbi:MAG TPA: gamma-glutamyltransferase [Terriglobales bacterium]|nr:gamma-glutamyltransferase [Terriglobales bacterium]